MQEEPPQAGQQPPQAGQQPPPQAGRQPPQAGQQPPPQADPPPPQEKPKKKEGVLSQLVQFSGNAKAIAASLAALAATVFAIVKFFGPDDDPKPPPGTGVTDIRGGGTTGGGTSGGTTGSTSGGQTGFRVTEVITHVSPARGTVDCPAVLTFTSRINALGGAGTVTYRWLRDDGASAPVETIRFAESGSEDVETTWTRGGPGDRMEGWQALEILEPPGGPAPQRAHFDVQCNP